MAAPIQVSDAEAKVMAVLWTRAPQSASEVIDALTEDTGWNHRTIRTLLARLAAKGAVTTTPRGRAYLYSPVLTRDEYVRNESRGFLERVFRGNPLSAVAHFVEDESLSPGELARLRKLIDRKEEEES
jgi:BlaI family transcriptional regulator, penicillinase repressor